MAIPAGWVQDEYDCWPEVRVRVTFIGHGSGRVSSGRVNIYVPATDTLQLHWDEHWAALDVSSALGRS